MPSLWVLSTITLALICAVLVYVMVVSRQKMQRRMEAQSAESQSALAEQERYATLQAQEWNSRERRIKAEHGEILTAEYRSHQDSLEQLRQWAASGMRWEAGSRDDIIEFAEDAGLDGFLATNVCFRTNGNDGAYVQQIDHLLVTHQKLMVIEAKNWKGLIFHFEQGTLTPIQEAVESLPPLKSINPGSPYVMHVREHHEPKFFTGKNDPTRQVIAQIVSLKENLQEWVGAENIGFFEACVFYSHPEGILLNESNRVGQTHVIDRPRMKRLLASSQGSMGHTGVPLEKLAGWAQKHGADLYGLGDYQNQWVSPFPTLRNSPTR